MTGVLTKTVDDDAAQGRIQWRGVGWLNPPPPRKKIPSYILLMNWRYTEGQTVHNRPTS